MKRGLVIVLTMGVVLACLAVSIANFSLWRGDHNGLNHAVGRDFINMWTASRLVEADRTGDIFDQDKFAAAPIAPLLLTGLLVYLYRRRDMRPKPGRDPG